MLKIILLGLGFVVIMVFFIFLVSGEFKNEIYAVINEIDKLSEKRGKMKAKYIVSETRPGSYPHNDKSTKAKLRELQYLRDIAKIDLCVLDTEVKVISAVTKATSRNRGQ